MNIEFSYPEDLQTKILALMVTGNDHAKSYRHVKCNYFSDPINQIIARAYLDKQDGTYSFDAITLRHLVLSQDGITKEESDNATARIYSLYRERFEGSYGKYISEEVNKFVRHQAIITAFMEGVEDIGVHRYDRLELRMKEALRVGRDSSALGMSIFDQDPADILNRCNINRIKTGYKTLDEYTNGGLGQGELGIIMAPTSRGKSIVVQDMAISALQHHKNLKILIITLEMPDHKYLQRLYSRVAGVGRLELGNYTHLIKSRMDRLRKTSGGDVIVKHLPAGRHTVADIESLMLDLQAEGWTPNILFVDYADLLKGAVKHESKRFELSEVYRDLAGLAGAWKIPIWTPTQTNRKGYTKELVDVDDIAEDYGKATIADVIVALCQTPEEKQSNVMRFFLAKNRDFIDKVSIQLMLNYEKMCLTDLGPC